ncbi:MAG: protein kinase [Acidobacteriota bacterium]
MLSREEMILSRLLAAEPGVSKSEVARCLDQRGRSSGGTTLAEVAREEKLLDDARLGELTELARELGEQAPPTTVAGRRLGDFRLVRELGRGGMGIVFEAEQDPLGRRVAVKVLSGGAALDQRLVDRFLAEARAVASLEHPHLVRILTSGEHEGVLFHAMELVDGHSLEDELEDGPLPLERALAVTRDVASALGAVHGAGLVHRDVKPGNILIDREGRAKLTDFGLVLDAKAVRATLTHQLLGTPAYMAPEQVHGGEVGRHTDIHGLGATLHAMLTGAPPVRGETPGEALAHLLSGEREDLATLAPELPVDFVECCEGAMHPDPTQRPTSALALADELDRLARDGATARRPRTPRRLLSVLALLTLTLAAGAWQLARRSADVALPDEDAPWVTRADLLSVVATDSRRFQRPRLSDDGHWIAWSTYPAEPRIASYLLDRRDGSVRLIDGLVASPSFAPDGERFAVTTGGYEVRLLSMSSLQVLDTMSIPPLQEHEPVANTWSPQGSKIALGGRMVPALSTRFPPASIVVDFADRSHQVLPITGADDLTWSPTGRRIAHRAATARQVDLWTVGLDGEPPWQLTDDPALELSPCWLSDGTLVFSRQENGRTTLDARLVDPDTGRALAPAVELMDLPVFHGVSLAVGDDETTLLVNVHRSRRSACRIQLDEQGVRVQDVRAVGGLIPEVAVLGANPRSSTLALGLVQGAGLLEEVGTPDEEWRWLFGDSRVVSALAWSPDGERLVLAIDEGAGTELWLQDLNGEPHPITDTGGSASQPTWSPDGHWIAHGSADGARMFQPDRPDLTPRSLRPDDPSFRPSSFSPDGRRLLGQGVAGIELLDLTDGDVTPLATDGEHLRWFPDGRRFLFVRDGVLHVMDAETRQHRALLAPAPARVASDLSLSADGRVIHCVLETSDREIWALDLGRLLSDRSASLSASTGG